MIMALDPTSMLMAAAAIILGSCGMLWMAKRLAAGRASRGRAPPVKSGWVPWLGCAVQFGKEPLHFLQRTQRELGDVFTIHAAGKKLTYIANSKYAKALFTSPHTNFIEAVLPYVQGACCVDPKAFKQQHKSTRNSFKKYVPPVAMATMCPQLFESFCSELRHYGNEGEMELLDFARHVMFATGIKLLYGRENAPKSRSEMLQFEKQFMKFDEGFQYSADIPAFFLKEWRNARTWLLNFHNKLFTNSWKRREQNGVTEKTLLEDMLDSAESSAHNMAILFLWGLQANAIPVTFWTLAHILSDSAIYAQVKDEVDQVLPVMADGTLAPLTEESLKELGCVKRCVLEGIRLNPPATVLRKAVEDIDINGYTIPKGHLIMLCPYLCHRNEELFTNAEEFNPDRWLKCDIQKNQFLDGFVSFGGGNNSCPGRWYALTEMQLFVAMTIRMYDLELLDPVPPPDPQSIVGTQHPAKSCRIHYKLHSRQA